MMQWLRDRMQRKGQAMVEYAVILVLVAVVVLVALATVGNQVNATFIDVQEALMNPNAVSYTHLTLPTICSV